MANPGQDKVEATDKLMEQTKEACKPSDAVETEDFKELVAPTEVSKQMDNFAVIEAEHEKVEPSISSKDNNIGNEKNRSSYEREATSEDIVKCEKTAKYEDVPKSDDIDKSDGVGKTKEADLADVSKENNLATLDEKETEVTTDTQEPKDDEEITQTDNVKIADSHASAMVEATSIALSEHPEDKCDDTLEKEIVRNEETSNYNKNIQNDEATDMVNVEVVKSDNVAESNNPAISDEYCKPKYSEDKTEAEESS